MIGHSERESRIKSLVALMKEKKLSAILAIGNGCVGTNAYGCYRYITDNRIYCHISAALLFSDGSMVGIAESEAEREENAGGVVREFVISRDPPGDLIRLLRKHGIISGAVGTCLELLPTSWLLRLRSALPGLDLKEISGDVFTIRNHHSDEEIRRIRICGHLADAGYKGVLEHVHAGMTEQQLAAEIEYAIQKGGGEYNFTLVSTGPFSLTDNGLRPIRAATMLNRQILPGDAIAMEITPRYEGYWTQLVRTVSVGPANEDLQRMHGISNRVIESTLPELYPGNRIGKIAAQVRMATEQEGFIFQLPSGHICGLDLNEERLAEDNDRRLEPGMVVILHPTIIGPNITNGIFWGQSYLITENGYQCLMDSDTDLHCV